MLFVFLGRMVWAERKPYGSLKSVQCELWRSYGSLGSSYSNFSWLYGGQNLCSGGKNSELQMGLHSLSVCSPYDGIGSYTKCRRVDDGGLFAPDWGVLWATRTSWLDLLETWNNAYTSIENQLKINTNICICKQRWCTDLLDPSK